MRLSDTIIRLIERQTGESAKTMRDMTVCELRRRTEVRLGRPYRFGHAMRQRLLSAQDVERGLDEVLKDSP